MNQGYVDAIDAALDKFPNLCIGVIGDFFLDKYLVIDPALEEVSIETGKPANQVVEIYHSPGAAGTVVNNLCALEIGRVMAIGAIGNDGEGYELLNNLRERSVDCQYLIQSPKIFTPTYTKPMRIEGNKRVEQERLDIKNRQRLLPEIEEIVLKNLRAVIEKVDGLIIADQVEEENMGIITDRVRTALIQTAKEYPDKVIFADSRARISKFENMILKPNKFEAYRAINGESIIKDVPMEVAKECGKKLSERNQRPVLVTLQEDGVLVCTPNSATHVLGIRVEGEIDAVGAGDSFLAGYVAARCAGADDVQSAYMGVVVSSITVQKIGTTGTASPDEVMKRNHEQLQKD